MRCAQTGCEISADTLLELGEVPIFCPTCGHPLAFVMTRTEIADSLGIPEEEVPTSEHDKELFDPHEKIGTAHVEPDDDGD